MRQRVLRIILMFCMIGSLSITHSCKAQLTGHSYALASFGSAFLFKKVWSAFNTKQHRIERLAMSDPANVIAALDSIPSCIWETLFIVCLYKSAFHKSSIKRSDISSYIMPLIPSIGGLLAGAVVIMILDKVF